MSAFDALARAGGRAARSAFAMVGGTPAARARGVDQAFDFATPLFRGQRRDISGAMPRPSGSGALGRGIYAARKPDTTRIFSGERGGAFTDGANISPLVARGRVASAEQYVDELERQAKRLRVHRDAPEASDAAHAALQRQGYTGIYDAASDYQLMFVDDAGETSNLRSVFAAFDPRRASESDLLASIAAAFGAGAALDIGGNRERI